jgi:ABC-type uncharacterized transport system substrate-binding protein
MGTPVTRALRWFRFSISLSAFVLLWPASAAAKPQETRRVLVFYDQGRSTAAIALMDSEIHKILEKQTTYHLELYVEYMESTLFVEPGAQDKIRAWYGEKYRNHQPDVIIAEGEAPVQFMIGFHAKYFPNVPIVLCGSLQNWTGSSKLDSQFTGTWLQPSPEKTVDAALQLQPGTQQVIVLNGSSSLDKGVEDVIRKSLHSYEDKLKLTYLSGLPMSALLPMIRDTPNHTIILYGAITQDGTGTRFIAATQSLPMIIRAANAPVFTMAESMLGQGAVGGNVVNWTAQGRIAAEEVLRLLNGEKPQDIPIVRGPNTYLFDWRAMKRWDLKEKNLPVGSILLNRQSTFLEAYGRYVFVGLLVLFAQLFLILQLLSQRAKERAIRRHLNESESQLREAQSISKCGSWVLDIAKNKVRWSDEMYRILGLAPGSVTPLGPATYSTNGLLDMMTMKRLLEVSRP